MANKLWVVTAVLHADNGTLIGAIVGSVDPATEKPIDQAALKEIPEIVKMLRDGDTMVAVYPTAPKPWSVQIVTLPNGAESIETIPNGDDKDRTMAQLFTLDELVAMSERVAKATRH